MAPDARFDTGKWSMARKYYARLLCVPRDTNELFGAAANAMD